MVSHFNLNKSVIIVHSSESAYEGIYLGIDTELEQVIKDALEKHGVIVLDSINAKATYDEKVIETDNILATLQNPQDTALRCVILLLR